MSAKMTHEASSSSSSSHPWKYDVFLSFYGKDTRNSFTAHLFTALDRDGICTFRDDKELNRGEDISSELMDAIEGSTIAIVVFSANFASSTWCLNELVKILACKKKYGQKVLPVFYKLDPSVVRHQKGTFGEAFVRHTQKFKEEMGKMETWKAALTEVANLSGWDQFKTANGDESELIKKIVEEVSKIIMPTNLDVAAYPIGLESHIEHISCLLKDGCVPKNGLDFVRFLEIYGCGGIGKTTIAKAVFNLMSQKFEGSSFLSNVREASSKQNGLASLQKQLLSDVLKKEHKDISNEDIGINIIKRFLCQKRVLIVLDDVDEMKQLNKLAGAHDWFGPGSRVIITTRDEHLLKMLQVDKNYKVETMSHSQSLQLFSLHAFGHDYPSEDYVGLSNDVVKYAGGLPIALVILGSLLHRRTRVDWESELEKLRKIPNDQIFKILEISYDALDDFNKKIFLFISCFFVGWKKDDPITFLDGCGLFAKSGIGRLSERSLVTISEDNEICMHDLIRDMGREIVRRQLSSKPSGCNMLWDHDDALDVLRNLTDLPKLKVLHVSGSHDCRFRMPDLSRLPSLERLSFWRCESLDPVLNLSNLKRLRDLSLSDLEELNEIEGLERQESLETISLHDLTNLRTLSSEVLPSSLRSLDASYCSSLERLPSLLNLKHLRILALSYCEKLNEIEGLEGLESVETICLVALTNLRSLSQEVLPSSLHSLDASGCHSLERLPNMSNLKYLRILALSYCKKLNEIEGLEGLESVETISLHALNNLRSLSSEVLPSSLHTLDASGCRSLERLPNLSNLKHLRILCLVGCEKVDEIEGLEGLESLETINLDGCFNLRSFSMELLPSSLCSLDASYCKFIERIPNLSNLKFLGNSRLAGCQWSTEIEGLEGLQYLETIELNVCINLRSLSHELLPSSWCSLGSSNSRLLERILNLSNLKHLRKLDLSECQDLTEFEGLKSLETPETIKLNWCVNLRNFSNELLPSSFHSLHADNCQLVERLRDLSNLKHLSYVKHLQDLDLSGCQELTEIEGLKGLQSLETLRLDCCVNLRSLSKELLPSSLRYLYASNCRLLERLPNLSNLKHLKILDLRLCENLYEIEGVEGMQSLETVYLYGCDSLRRFFNPNGGFIACRNNEFLMGGASCLREYVSGDIEGVWKS